MRRRVLLFAGLGLLLVTAGYLVASQWSGAPSETVQPPAKRQPVTFIPEAGVKPAEVEEEVVVLSVSGKVERSGEGQPWNRAKVGDVLGREESIRTGPHASARLSLGEGSKLAVDNSTELRVGEVSAKLHRVRLRQGRVSVDYKEHGDRELELQGGDGKVIARAKAAQFSMLQSGRTVAVATETGTVDLAAGNKVVKVEAGQQSVVRADSPPSLPMVLSKDVLLKVASLPARLIKRLTTVVGQAAPGSRVTVDGKPVELDKDGHFRAQVELSPGKNRIAIVTQDVAGRRREELVQLMLKEKSPAPEVRVNWGKKPKLEVKWKQKGDE